MIIRVIIESRFLKKKETSLCILVTSECLVLQGAVFPAVIITLGRSTVSMVMSERATIKNNTQAPPNITVEFL